MSLESPDLIALKRLDLDEWRKEFPRLWGMAFNTISLPQYGLTRSEAEDAASEAIIGLFKQLDDIATGEELHKRAFATARNKAVDLLRHELAGIRDRSKTISRDDSDHDLEANAPPPLADGKTAFDDVDFLERADRLREILRRLKPPEGDLLLKRYNGASHKEIGAAHGIPVHQVGWQLGRALSNASKIAKTLGFFEQ